MLSEFSQNNNNVETYRKNLNERIVNEGLELWKRQKEHERLKKLREQKEMRDLLGNYWPFGRASDIKPRGLRNLRVEEIYPYKEFLNAKRFVGTLNLGRPGGGAPLVTATGKKLTRTREDPLLRFQFGSEALRKCVDNTLRYKTDKKSQQEYKQELDRMVEEKRRNKENAKAQELQEEKEQQQVWSSDRTMRELPKRPKKQNNPVFYPCKSVYAGSKNRKLSPLCSKDGGMELVPILAKKRFPLKTHLESTDVTNQNKNVRLTTIWSSRGSAHLRELAQQICAKQQKLQEMKAAENAVVKQHFFTIDHFWGRPGNGAPRAAIKKQRLDALLYPQMIAAH